jgi:hypothetical protein
LDTRKLSELPDEERDQVLAYVKSRWNQYANAARESRKDAANFVATINAGGAATVLAFAGAVLDKNAALAQALPLRIAICLFVLGMLLSALAHAAEHTRISGLFGKWRTDVDKLYNDVEAFGSIYDSDVKRASENEVVPLFLIWLALGCFGIGAGLGALLLLGGN